ncbi:unnamed protein product [Rotaria sp. Silwood1]|nr:unnamed protein product [Rotaria sp. Silwood1]CAF3483346.1 unnamed protein product [Rotaria sp. Silwood1]CAF3494140.1 unnamed protein product [Rotaria sp. Silwood1]CAF3512053.1 unnamed protein product [Rotaria sp. Silwood1]CAF4750634.1 unnamed protein product [Rotaria sp. Silwood1]
MTHTSESHSNQTVAIVGGGLGGTLCACFFAKHGINVHLFELRPDIRTQKVVKGRSINMALSRRGRDALAYVHCEDVIVRNGIPMRARMLHDLKCHTKAVPYGTRPEHEIISIDRRILNELLLDEANKYSEIKIHFQHKFINWNPEEKQATFQNKSGEYVDFKADALIGYDGCHSAVRAAMMKIDSVDFSQEFIESHYMEFCIPPKDGKFAMEINYLHIWPRHDFMLIALPNQDKSFTTTLFLPLSIFQKITTTDELLTFFQQYFPDAISFIGRENLIETYFSSKPLPLISIKCSPHVSTNGDVLLMGDAAHSMVPFYAQGMNSAFEDTLVLFEKLKENNFHLSKAFFAYNKTRIPDAHAIVDLSMYNYREMRHLVTLPSYYWRKQIDRILHFLMPNWWIPLYTMVAFTRIPYKKCVDLRQQQDQILKVVRFIAYSITGIYLIKQYAFTIIKPIATKFIVQKILPKFAADKVV